jgi:hypothetical protein
MVNQAFRYVAGASKTNTRESAGAADFFCAHGMQQVLPVCGLYCNRQSYLIAQKVISKDNN